MKGGPVRQVWTGRATGLATSNPSVSRLSFINKNSQQHCGPHSAMLGCIDVQALNHAMWVVTCT